MPNPSRLIRERAATLPEGDATRQWLEELATEFEQQHVKQNNELSAALGYAELAFDEKFDEVRRRLDTSDERQRTILELLEQLQADVHALAARQVGDRDTSGDDVR